MQSYMALQSCNDIWTLFECFPKRNKQASHLNVCLLLLGVLACAWRRLIYAVSLALLRIICPTLYMFHHLCSPVSSNPSDGVQPPRFQSWTMTPSSWWLDSSGGISTTLWIQTFSTDHLHCAISNRMTSSSVAFSSSYCCFACSSQDS